MTDDYDNDCCNAHKSIISQAQIYEISGNYKTLDTQS